MARLVNHDDNWHENEKTARSLDEAAKGLTGDAAKRAKQAAKDLRKTNGD